LYTIWTPPGLDPGSSGVTTFCEFIKINLAKNSDKLGKSSFKPSLILKAECHLENNNLKVKHNYIQIEYYSP